MACAAYPEFDASSAHEQQLVQACLRETDPVERSRLLSELYRRYYVRVRDWCIRFSGNRDAADLTQEVFLRAHKYFESFKGDSAFGTWLYVIARNYCTNHAHACAVRPLLTSADYALHVADERADHFQRSIEREASYRVVYELLERTLDETEIQVFTLHYAGEQSLSAITQRLKLTNTSGAKAYIVSAKRKLGWAIAKKQPAPKHRSRKPDKVA